MLQDESSVGWDPIAIQTHISPILRIYVLFLLVTLIVTMVKLTALWIAGPPFRLSRQMNNPDYLRRLRAARVSIQQWLICTLLGCGFVASVGLFQTSNRLLETKWRDAVFILFAIRDLSLGPEMASFVAVLLFLAQWHLLNRIERLDKSSRIVPESHQ